MSLHMKIHLSAKLVCTLTLCLGAISCSQPDPGKQDLANEEAKDAAKAEEILKQNSPPSMHDILQATKARHGIEHWNQQDSLQADVVVDFGGKRMVDGTFTFEAHGPKARYDKADGTVIVFDGETAWTTGEGEPDPMARFHVLTWPWFLLAPFKMDGDGIKLSDMKNQTIQGKEYISILQEFKDGTGDSPDDWYRLFIAPGENKLRAMSYIVTYTKSKEEANKSPSIVFYRGHSDIQGAQIPSEMEFWYLNEDKETLKGDGPKGTATAKNMKFITPGEGFYAKPEGAREIPLPSP